MNLQIMMYTCLTVGLFTIIQCLSATTLRGHVAVVKGLRDQDRRLKRDLESKGTIIINGHWVFDRRHHFELAMCTRTCATGIY